MLNWRRGWGQSAMMTSVYVHSMSFPIPMKTSLYSFSMSSFVMGNLCFFPFMSTASSNSWILRCLRPSPSHLLPPALMSLLPSGVSLAVVSTSVG